MAEGPRILVVGSINMDLIVRCSHTPAQGETVKGTEFMTSPGGKGANQAVAAGRLGGNCAMIGAVGEDDFGQQLLENLKNEGIDCGAVEATSDASTGVAMIVVDSEGENTVITASGANMRVTPDDSIYPNAELFEQASVVLLQLELPLPTIRSAIDMSRRCGCKVILDPAPSPAQMPIGLCKVDIISPNVREAERITGQKAGLEQRVDKQIASELIALGASAAVLKLGARGSMVVTADGRFHTIPAYKVRVVDTTSAGDAFTAALAVAVARGDTLREAAKYASAAGSLTCTKLGAQNAMPTADEVRFLIADQPLENNWW